MSSDFETIDPGVAEPVYRQLAVILRARIRAGRYQPRHAIASETQLQQEFGLSRNTIRRAIAILRTEGLVVTVAGRGSYVADPLPEESLDVFRDVSSARLIWRPLVHRGPVNCFERADFNVDALEVHRAQLFYLGAVPAIVILWQTAG